MKIGIVSDIHGNIAALEKAFSLLPEADSWFCLGDAINQFRFCNDVVALIRERCSHTILGNHEEVFFGPHGHRARSMQDIDKDLMDWLGSQSSEQHLAMADRSLHLVHSTPWLPRGDYIYPNSTSFERFGESCADVLLYGHTHQPVACEVNGTLVVNPGSVGEGRPVQHGYIFSFAVLDLIRLHADIIEFTL